MKRFALYVSVAPFALMAFPAYSQTTVTAATQDAPAADEQKEKAPAGESGTEADPRDIVVTGYRASLGTAQAIKRNSDAILDAIVAQDIGKLPDNTAAESLARVTGVQVNRFSDEVSQVLVRGLPDVATTQNRSPALPACK